jgi:hypothetical protein
METVIHSFVAGGNGFSPSGEVVLNKNGWVVGTTAGVLSSVHGYDGTLFALKPPATSGGVWSETILAFKGFPNDGANPFGSLLLTKNGVLYGTTALGGRVW